MILADEELIKIGLNILIHFDKILTMIEIKLLFDIKPPTYFI